MTQSLGFRKRMPRNRGHNRKKILLLGGWGHRNAGDEAILQQSLAELRSRYPDHIIRVLTPDQNYTHAANGRCDVADAPRTAFFDQDRDSMYSLRSTRDKLSFALRAMWVYCNAFLDAHFVPHLLGAKRSALLWEIKTSSLVFFAGGGYLTGATHSRLLDGCLFILICRLYGVPVVLSGQTIGLWNNWLDRWLAGKAFRYAKIITVRDPEASLNDLGRIGISATERVFATFDDALFCEKEEDTEKINDMLRASGMSNAAIEQGFVTVNTHYWGAKTEEDRALLGGRFQEIAQYLLAHTSLNILFVPMSCVDEESMYHLLDVLPRDRAFVFKSDGDFRSLRAVIGRSEACVTRRHHPLIFAIGEKVPVISIAYHPYFAHKNGGSLEIVNWGDFTVSLEDENYLDRFQKLYERIEDERENLLAGLDERFEQLRSLKGDFYEQVSTLL